MDTMAKAEIDSFILKFKNLLLSGRNAMFVIKSNAGKAEVSLNVELGLVPPPPAHHQDHRSLDGPSRQRRRLSRAQARSGAAQAEEVIDVQVQTAAEAKESEKDLVQTEPETLKDEFCLDDTFEKQAVLLPLLPPHLPPPQSHPKLGI